MLELKQVSKVVEGETHLDDISLTMEKGSLNVLLGPTLSGKTSLMRLMAGLDKPTHGTIHVDGMDVTGIAVQKRNVAMVYQQFINYPAMTVYENIASPLRIQKADPTLLDQKVREAAELMKLTPYLDRKPLNLSGGQQQRTALARAIVKDAQLVLLDEPLANLDYKLREELREELPKIFARSGAIFVYATTEPTEALLLGGHTATLSEGRVTQFGPTLNVFRRPTDLMTAQTFSDPPLNTIEMSKSGDVFHFGNDHHMSVPPELRDIADDHYIIGFRPHHLAPKAGGSDHVSFPVTVKVTEITGSESYVHIHYENKQWVMLTRGIHDFDAGEDIHVHLDPHHLMVFDQNGHTVAGHERPAA